MTLILTLAIIATCLTLFWQRRSIQSHTRAIEAINVTNLALMRANEALSQRVGLLEGRDP